MSDPCLWRRIPLIPRFVSGLAVLVGLSACGAEGGEASPPVPAQEVRVDAPEGPAPPTSTPPAPPPSVMAGVVEHAIVPPPEGGSTYRVDAYVAVLVVEHLRRSVLPFVPWRTDAPEPGGPSAGYRVGTLVADGPWSRLGLREGDIVAAVNGVSTADAGWAERALERSENRVTVSIVRDGIGFVSSYRLVEGMAWSDRRGASFGGSAATPDVEPHTDSSAAALDPAATDERSIVARDAGSSAGGARSGGSSGRRRPPAPGGGSGLGSGLGSGPASGPGAVAVARCSSASSCTLDRAHFDRLVRSPANLRSQANVVPAIRNDVFSGYKLKSVRSGTAVHQLGFRSGDKITHINGRDLTNDFEAMQVYLGLSNTRTFRVRYVRGGSARTKTITVK